MNSLFTSIRRTPYQSLASFFILFFTLLLSLFLFYVISFFHGILPYVESKVQVIGYFNVNAKESDILKVKDKITSSGKALSIKYVNKKEALERYKDYSKDDPLLTEMVTADILPASLEIYAKKPQYLSEIDAQLKKEKNIKEVVFQKTIVDNLIRLTNTLRTVSLFIFGFFIAISALVLMTMTGFKIALKKEEIELQRLLGATTWYIRKPFLLEGILFGTFSGVLAFGVFYLIFFYFKTSFLDSFLRDIPSLAFFNLSHLGITVWPVSTNFILVSLFITVLFGILIGFIGNLFATGKYIK